MDDLGGDPFALRTEEEIGVGRGGGGVADDEKGDVDGGGVGEDGVGFELDGFARGDDDFFAVEFFLISYASQLCMACASAAASNVLVSPWTPSGY